MEAFEAQIPPPKERSQTNHEAFVAQISHEIRTPLNAIIGITELLEESATDEHQRRLMLVLRTAGDHLLELIDDLLDVSKAEAGQLNVENIEFHLRDVLVKTIDFLSDRARRKQIQLDCHIATDVPLALLGDPLRLRQIVVNLVGNAIKFTERGHVSLQVEVASPAPALALRFSVRDTGIGIPQEKIEEIFTDFVQADESIARRFGGTGLGLGIARRLIRLLGGTIEVESKPGIGSLFWFTLPFAQPNVVRGERTSSSFVRVNGVPVLVVADKETDRVVLREMLSAWGAIADEADGAAARQVIEQAVRIGRPYHVIVVDADHRLDLQAIELALGEGKVAPIVLASTHGAMHGREVPSGVAARVGKPIRRRELMEAIGVALDRSPYEPVTPASRLVDPRPLRVLIVDDNQENRLVVNHHLADCGYRCDSADDGRAAVERFASARYDVVLMDIQMAGLDGLGATRAMRTMEAEHGWPRAAIIALTAHASPEDVEHSLAAGCTTHIHKPIRRANLLRVIMQHTASIAAPRATSGDGPQADMLAPIQIPIDLMDLMGVFLTGRRKDVTVLTRAADDGDFATIRAVGHMLAGLGGTYGFPQITEMGRAIETAVGKRDLAQVRAQTARLDAFMHRIAAELEGT